MKDVFIENSFYSGRLKYFFFILYAQEEYNLVNCNKSIIFFTEIKT